MPKTPPVKSEGNPLTDPVTGFTYPKDWVSACRDSHLMDLVRSGLGVLTSDGKVLKRGYSTGTTAAAASKAALLSLKNPVADVRIRTPCGLTITVPVEGRDGHSRALKYPGDYPEDATAGIVFEASAFPDHHGIILNSGRGIGRWERDTPRFRKGEPGISPAALQTILDAITEAMQEAGLAGARIELSVPDGEAVGARTLNPRLGVVGGISVLGTTGLVEPWDDHLAGSVLDRIRRSDRVVLTTGRLGLRYSRLLFPEHEVILAGSCLAEAVEQAGGEVILCGLPGLILKFLEPDILAGTGCVTVEELSQRPGFKDILTSIFGRMQRSYPDLRVVILSRDGTVLGDST